jgi:hypothetical protein
MRNRKRHTARPSLEPMESRVVLSVTAIHVHHERAVVAAHVSQVSQAHVSQVSSAKASTANQLKNIEAMRNLQQQLNVVHEHALERTPSAIPTAAEKRATQISNIFKSLESAL